MISWAHNFSLMESKLSLVWHIVWRITIMLSNFGPFLHDSALLCGGCLSNRITMRWLWLSYCTAYCTTRAPSEDWQSTAYCMNLNFKAVDRFLEKISGKNTNDWLFQYINLDSLQTYVKSNLLGFVGLVSFHCFISSTVLIYPFRCPQYLTAGRVQSMLLEKSMVLKKWKTTPLPGFLSIYNTSLLQCWDTAIYWGWELEWS